MRQEVIVGARCASRIAIGAALALWFHLATPEAGLAQEATAPTPQRPRIGLALSGGGARGAAHVGVLKVLEELRVPVHCITGTSMGSIVGGAYAAGVAPNEMAKILGNTDWTRVFSDQPPRTEISIRRKQDDYKNLFAPEFGFKDYTIMLPKGVITGVSIESFLRDLTESAAKVSDFSQLPIPFRAVAADIVTGEQVVLAHGSLAEAMRASMSIPGAVAPVEMQGHLLVDGGIANNLPIDLVREMCGEVIIAVNIGTPAMNRDELGSALAVVEQLINFLGKATVDKQIASLGSRDVLIAPDLGDISSASFGRVNEAIAIGETAARASADNLRRYSLPPEEYAALRREQRLPPQSLGTVAEIRFEGLERTNPEVLRELLQTKPGEPLSEETIGEDLRRIYGRGDFEGVNYRIEENATGQPSMVISVREKSWGPNYLRFGLGLASDFRGQNYFNIAASYRRTWLNRLGGEWLVDAQIGQNSFISTEFYQPVEERARLFVAPYASYGQYLRPVFVGNTNLANYLTRELRGGLDLGATLGTWGELRIGPVWRNVHAEVETGPAGVLPTVDTKVAGLRVRLFVDQLDRPWFSRSGYAATVTYFDAISALGSDLTYQRGEADVTGVKSFGPHTISLTAAGGTSFGTNIPPFDRFLLGGPLRLSAYRIDQFAGEGYAFVRAMYYNQILRLPPPFGTGVYLGGSLEGGLVNRLDDGRANAGGLFSISGFVAADTFLGPAYLGVGFGPAGNYSFYLLLGRPLGL